MTKYRFTGRIEAGEGGGAFVFFPHCVEEAFQTRGKVPVRATFNGVPYRGSMIKYGHPQHMLPMLKQIREKLGLQVGDAVDVELWRDEEARTLDVPEVFQRAMEEAGTLPFFEQLSYTHRKEYCRWVSEAKREEMRQKRLGKAIELLRRGVKTPDGPDAR